MKNEANINKEEIEEDDTNEVKITEYYKDKDIAQFFESFVDNRANRIIEELNNYYEKGDMKNLAFLIRKLALNKIFRIFKKDKKIQILDIITKKIIPYIYFYSFLDINTIILFLAFNYISIPRDYILDWKQFYFLLSVRYPIDNNNKKNYFMFYSNIYKFLPKDAMTIEEYQAIKNTFLDEITNGDEFYAKCFFIYFFPEKYLNEDDELQIRLFYKLKNDYTDFVPLCRLFFKILNHNGKLYFSKDPKKNDDFIKEFIKYYFTYLNLYILDEDEIWGNIEESPIYNENKKKKIDMDENVIDILYYLLFNESLKDYSSYIENHLMIILNNKHLYLKERSNDNSTLNYIQFLQLFLYKIGDEFNKKIYNKIIERKIKIPKSYEKNKYIYDRLLIILKYFSLNFEKIFLYDNDGNLPSQRELFTFISSAPIDEDYMKQFLKNINFDNYIKMLRFFLDNSETRMAKFTKKLYCIIPLFLNEYVFSNYSNVRDLIKESIIFLSENVTSANSSVAMNILIIFSYEFFRIKDLSKKNKIYEFLIPVITDSTLRIMNNLLRIIDLICEKDNINFYIFVISMKKFLDEETEKKITLTYANFIENNDIDSSSMEFYFYVLNEKDHLNIFNNIYNNLLYIDKSNNIEINKHFLYEKIDNDFNINVSNCSIEIFIENKLEGFTEIFCFMNFSKIITNENMIKKFYELYYALINQKEMKFQKLGIELFSLIMDSLLQPNIIKNFKDENSIPLIEYPNEKNINIVVQMYEKIILPYEKFINEYLEKYANNQEKLSNKVNNDIDKNTLEQIFFIYIKLIHKVVYIKCNLILNTNFEGENLEEYKIIQDKINYYKKFKNLTNNSLKVINKIFDYNKKDIDTKLFNNHLTDSFLNEIVELKLKISSSTIDSEKNFYKNINGTIYRNDIVNNFQDFYKINRTYLIHFRHFRWIQMLSPKDDYYYIFLNLYLQDVNSVDHSSSYISSTLMDYYSINKEKIKNLYNEIYNVFIEYLKKLNTTNLTEQNIMGNIWTTFLELSILNISLFLYDALNVIEKLFQIILLLKEKKYKRIDYAFAKYISKIRDILEIKSFVDIKKDRRFKYYLKRNDIVEEQINKIYEIISQNVEKSKYSKEYNNIIKQFAEKELNLISPSDLDIINKKSPILDVNEVLFIFRLLIDFINIAIDKKDSLYRKIVQFIFNNMIFKKFPVSKRVLFIQNLYFLIKDEYSSYIDHKWIIFKSKEEYVELWNKLKYELEGRKRMISFPLNRIRINIFKDDEYLNNNLKYDFNIEEFLYNMAEIDEYEEDLKLVNKTVKKSSSLDEAISKIVQKKFNEKKGLDFKKAKMFYYMLKLKYIDYNCDFVKNFNINCEFSKNIEKKMKQKCVIYEFLLGKYEYMLENKLFKENHRNELWEIMNDFTSGVDKIIDERVYAFFNYIFSNYSLGDLEFIFDYDYYKYPVDFVADIYFLYNQDLPNLRKDTKIFINSKTEELLTKIFSKDENMIADINYLDDILKMYYETNGILNYNYYYFESDFTDKIYEHFMGIINKSDTKHKRYGLFKVYIFFFYYLNNNLSLLKAAIQKMGLCVNEFMNADKSISRDNEGKDILKILELSFISFTGNIHFPSLCNEIIDILNKENDRNDTNKLVYLQVVNNIYEGQKHLNISKYSSEEIFESLFKVFISIKNEELKKNFSSVFLSYFNDLSEEENKQFIQKYEKYIYENVDENNEDKNKYNYIYILMNQLLRFKIRLPEYIQEFIIKLKKINKNENHKLKKIIIYSLKRAMNNYSGSYIYMKENISEECKTVLEELTREKAYFI